MDGSLFNSVMCTILLSWYGKCVKDVKVVHLSGVFLLVYCQLYLYLSARLGNDSIALLAGVSSC